MSVTDLIADQLTVIRNAIMAGKKSVIIKRSGVIEGIVGILKNEGFIENYTVIEDNKQNKIKIYLKYTADESPVMKQLERVSTPGLRKYVACEDINLVMGGVGISILSTSRGLLTGREAKDHNIGGEMICRIY